MCVCVCMFVQVKGKQQHLKVTSCMCVSRRYTCQHSIAQTPTSHLVQKQCNVLLILYLFCVRFIGCFQSSRLCYFLTEHDCASFFVRLFVGSEHSCLVAYSRRAASLQGSWEAEIWWPLAVLLRGCKVTRQLSNPW